MTDRRLVFKPNRLDSATRGHPWSVDLSDIVEVGVEGREADVPFMGKAAKLRRRLRIRTTVGVELFVVNGVDEAVAQLQPR